MFKLIYNMFWNIFLFSSGVYFSREFPAEAAQINKSIDDMVKKINLKDIQHSDIFKLFFKK